MTENSIQTFNYLEKRRDFKIKEKAFFIIFKGLSVARNCLRLKSVFKEKWSTIQFDVFDLSFIFFIHVRVINRSDVCYFYKRQTSGACAGVCAFLHASNYWCMCWRVRVQSHASNEKTIIFEDMQIHICDLLQEKGPSSFVFPTAFRRFQLNLTAFKRFCWN